MEESLAINGIWEVPVRLGSPPSLTNPELEELEARD